MTIRNFVIFLFTLVLSASAYAQSRTHTVKSQETKYGISKLYGVSIEELEKLNPDIKSGLKLGTVLVIPDTKAVNKSKGEPQRNFIIHTVGKGETLYALAKQYGVQIEDIKSANDGLKDGLKEGSKLSIPRRSIDSNAATENLAQKDTNYFYHLVQAGETAYSLSKKYKISLDSLYILNPQAKNGLQINSEVKLPKNRKSVKGRKPQGGLVSDEPNVQGPKPELTDSTSGKFFLYKVQVGDSFFSLRKKFKVTKQELIALNPELANGIELDKYIIIPGQKEGHEQVKNTSWLDKLFRKVDTVESADVPLVYDPNLAEIPQSAGEKGVDLGRPYQIVMMLPFTIPEPDSMMVEEMDQMEIEKDLANPNADLSKYEKPPLPKNSITSIEFYHGFLLAADTLAKQGMPIDIKVFDTRRDRKLVGTFADSLRKDIPDLVVGPLFKSNVELLADELKDSSVFVVSPLSRTVSAEWRPNLIQCIPGEDAMARKTGEIINDEYQLANVIFAHTGTAKESRTILKIKAHMLAREDGSYMGDVTFTEDMLKRNELDQVIAPNKKNLFVIVSEDKVFLSDLVNKLRQLRDTSISIIAPHKVMDIPTLDIDYLDKLKLTMADPDFINYSDSVTINFVLNYRKRYGTEPSNYSFQGYDVGMIFLNKLWQSGARLDEALNSEEHDKGLKIGLKLSQEEYSGFQNEFLYVTGIRDMMFVRLDEESQASEETSEKTPEEKEPEEEED